MPITQSAKPATTSKPITLSLSDWSGGLCADNAVYPLALADNQLSGILNFKYVKTPQGVKLKSRDGLTKLNTTPFPMVWGIMDIFGYTTAAGVSYTMVVSNSDLNYLDGVSYTKVADLSSANHGRGRMCQFNNKLIVADSGALKYWDGTTFKMLRGSTFLNNLEWGSYQYKSVTGGAQYYQQALWATTGKIAASQYIVLTPNYTPDVTDTFTIENITFYLAKFGVPTGNVYCKIYAADGSTVLYTSTAVDITTLPTTPAATSFVFSSLVTLSANTGYYISVYYNGGSSIAGLQVSEIPKALEDPIGWKGLMGDASYKVCMTASTGLFDDVHTEIDLVLEVNYGPAPMASFVIQKQNRIYCNDIKRPNWLWYCNANNPNDWSTEDGGGHIIFDGHYQINALAIFYDEIYIFCDKPKAVYRMSGDSPLEYSVKKLFTDATAISQDTVQSVGVDLFFVDTRGVISLKTMISYGDIEKALVSRDVNKTYPMGYVDPLYVFTGKCEDDNQFWLKTSNDNILIFDVELGEWTIFRFNENIVGRYGYKTAFGIVNGETYIGDSDGYLYKLDYTKKQDDGINFSLLATTGWMDLGLLTAKKANYLDVVLSAPAAGTYTLSLYKNLSSSVFKTLTMNQLYTIIQNINNLSFEFNQIKFSISGFTSSTGPHWLDRIVLECSILSRVT